MASRDGNKIDHALCKLHTIMRVLKTAAESKPAKPAKPANDNSVFISYSKYRKSPEDSKQTQEEGRICNLIADKIQQVCENSGIPKVKIYNFLNEEPNPIGGWWMHCEVDALLGCGTYFGVINRKVAEGSQQVGVELDLAFSENVSSAWDVLKKRPRICLIVVGENSKTIFDDWKKSAILKAMLKLLNCRFIFTDDQQTNAQIKKNNDFGQMREGGWGRGTERAAEG